MTECCGSIRAKLLVPWLHCDYHTLRLYFAYKLDKVWRFYKAGKNNSSPEKNHYKNIRNTSQRKKILGRNPKILKIQKIPAKNRKNPQNSMAILKNLKKNSSVRFPKIFLTIKPSFNKPFALDVKTGNLEDNFEPLLLNSIYPRR